MEEACTLYATGGAALLKQLWAAGTGDATPTTIDPSTAAGKVVLITGGGSGLGRSLARELALLGARVIIGCKDRAAAQRACLSIRAECDTAQIRSEPLDLRSRESIVALAEQIKAAETRLDVLVCNAAVMLAPFETTCEGYEAHFGINCLGHLYLAQLLLPLLHTTGSNDYGDHGNHGRSNRGDSHGTSARIINVSSAVHHVGVLDLDWLVPLVDGPAAARQYSSHGAYARSKLAVQLLTYALAERVSAAGLRVNVHAFDPGVVHTALYRHVNCVLRTVQKALAPLLFRPAAAAAKALAWVAVSPDLEHQQGRYYGGDCKALESSSTSLRREVQQQLWRHCGEITNAWNLAKR